jgi:hypothetical protein
VRKLSTVCVFQVSIILSYSCWKIKELQVLTSALAGFDRLRMKKKTLLFLMVLMLASPAMGEPIRPKARKAKLGQTVAPRTYTGNKMSGTANRFGSSKKDSSLFSGQTQNQSRRLSKTRRELTPGTSQADASAPQPLGDRPFDAAAPATNPFASPGSSPGSLWSPSISLESGVNPFKSATPAVNPFQRTSSTDMLQVPQGQGFSPSGTKNNPSPGLGAAPNTRTQINSSNRSLSPWAGPFENTAPIILNPYGSPPDFYSTGSQKSLYSPKNLSPRSSPRSPPSP